MISLCIDKGNSSIKIGVFDINELVYEASFITLNDVFLSQINSSYKPSACILCNVGMDDTALTELLKSMYELFIYFNAATPIPLVNAYRSPATLGKDRLAAAIGASFLMPNANLLIVDAGTAITYDFVDELGVYHGGNIAPGLKMRLKALNEFTHKLPLVALDEVPKADILIGDDTESAIQLGALNGIEFEIKGYYEALSFKYPELSIFLTGGDANYFVSKLKSPIFVNKNLVLTGLNRILQFNVKK